MTQHEYFLNDEKIVEPMFRDADETLHYLDALPLMSEAELAEIGVERREVELHAPTIEEATSRVDAERDRRMSSDFEYDFGNIAALDDEGNSEPAGVKKLQMGPNNIRDWGLVYSVAQTAAITGQGNTQIIPLRVEDNWNVQTTANQVLQVLSGAFGRGQFLTMRGGAIKTALRKAEANGEDYNAIDTKALWDAPNS